MHVRKWTHLARQVILASAGAVIVAAGSARRMAGVDKIMADLGASPFLVRTVRAFSGDGSCETNRHCHSSEFDRTGLRRREAAGFSKVKAVRRCRTGHGPLVTPRPHRPVVREAAPTGRRSSRWGEGHHQDRGRGRRRDRYPGPQYPPGGADASGV